MLGKGLESLIPPQKQLPEDAALARNDDSNNNSAAVRGSQSQSQGMASAPAVKMERGADRPLAPPTKTSAAAGKGAPSEKQAESVFYIEVAKIKPNPNQPRRHFDEAGLEELARSIREFGFLQPLVVSRAEKETPAGIEVEYQLIAGERRLLAAKLLGLEVVPAIVRDVELEREKLELAVVENIQREDLNPVEKARALARLQDEFRLTQREIAAKLGKSREAVANSVRLLDLPLYIQEALEKGQITESHGRLLLAVSDPGAQKSLFDDILRGNLTTRELRNRVQLVKPKGGKEEALPPELKMLQEKLSSELGAPVSIEQRGETKKLTIICYSDEELENVARRLGGEENFA